MSKSPERGQGSYRQECGQVVVRWARVVAECPARSLVLTWVRAVAAELPARLASRLLDRAATARHSHNHRGWKCRAFAGPEHVDVRSAFARPRQSNISRWVRRVLEPFFLPAFQGAFDAARMHLHAKTPAHLPRQVLRRQLRIVVPLFHEEIDH